MEQVQLRLLRPKTPSERAAWTIEEKATIIADTGIANLTVEEAEVAIHNGADGTGLWTLVRP